MNVVAVQTTSPATRAPSTGPQAGTGRPEFGPTLAFPAVLDRRSGAVRLALSSREARATLGTGATQTPRAAGPPPARAARSLGESREEDVLDPHYRRRAALLPPSAWALSVAGSVPGDAATARLSGTVGQPSAHAAVSLEDLMRPLVRRATWSGDGKRATACLEIGAGELAGSTLIVRVDAGRVHVELSVPGGIDASAWRDRIQRRLSERRIPTDGVDVT